MTNKIERWCAYSAGTKLIQWWACADYFTLCWDNYQETESPQHYPDRVFKNKGPMFQNGTDTQVPTMQGNSRVLVKVVRTYSKQNNQDKELNLMMFRPVYYEDSNNHS